jgi:uncharacterized protein (TIGR03437 family)
MMEIIPHSQPATSSSESFRHRVCGILPLLSVIGRALATIRLPPRLLGLLLLPGAAFAQALPTISSAGVVNAASYAQPISPGALVSIFGTNFANTTTSAKDINQLPVELGGTSVTVNGTKAPLLLVSSNQINLQIPWSLANSYFNYTQASVVVTTSAGSSVPVQVPVYQTSPSLFSLDSSGCGEAAVLNVGSDGSVSVNSPSNSAAPGDYVSLYGTGFGIPQTLPPDGTPSSGGDRFQIIPGVALDGEPLQYLLYAGLAPTLVGVDQINIQIPQGTREGCAVPITVGAGELTSPTLSISVHSGRGQCVDPPTRSYGTVTLTKTTSSGTAGVTEADALTASFPSGPGATAPPQPTPTVGGYVGNVTDVVTLSRSCPLNGHPQLSAGTITVQGANTGQTITAQPVPAAGGFEYYQTLPNAFITPGQYSISASGSPVTFQGVMTVPPPLAIQTQLPPGTHISASKPFQIQWTGAPAGTLVKISLRSAISTDFPNSPYDYACTDGSAGSFTFNPICTGNPPPAGNGVFCTFGLPSSNEASVVVEMSPSAGYASTVTAQGLTGAVRLSWIYRYVFSNLILDN